MKIGVLYSGIYWQEFGLKTTGYPFELIYIYRKKVKFDRYDIIVIPKGINQEFLKDCKENLEKFLDHGGTLISFGEMDGQWLYGTHWKSSNKGQQIEIVAVEHELFRDIDDNMLNQWSKAVHGYFEAIPSGAKKLVTVKGDKNKCIAFIDDVSRKGTVLAMTMDPDYHTYAEIDYARHFFLNIMNWACSKSYFNSRKNISRKNGFESFRANFKEQFNWKFIIIQIFVGVLLSLLFWYFQSGGKNIEKKIIPQTQNQLQKK
jgi:hypothetical protein